MRRAFYIACLFLLWTATADAEEAPPCLTDLAASSHEAASLAHEIVGNIAEGRFDLISAQTLVDAATSPADVRACALEQLGNAAFYSGESGAAIEAFSQSLKILEGLGDLAGQAFRLKDLAVCYRSQGRFMEALDAFQEARNRLPEDLEEDFAVTFLGNLGSLYERLGARRLAISTWEEALVLAEEDKVEEAWDLRFRLALLYLEGGASHHAVELLEKTADDARLHATDLESTWILGELAWARRVVGDLDGARAAAQASLEAARRSEDVFHQVAARIDLGDLHRAEDPDLAEAFYRKAIEMARTSLGPATSESGRSIWRAWIGLARIARDLGKTNDAITYGEQGIALFEAQRGAQGAWEDRSALSDWGHSEYGVLIDALLQRGDPGDLDRAFLLSERAKARTFAERQGAAPLDLETARRLLPEGTVLLSYLTGEYGTIVFSLRSDDLEDHHLDAHRLPLNAVELAGTIEIYLERLAVGGKEWVPTAERLYRELIGPVAASLEDAESLIISGDGPLLSLPFSTLIDPDHVDAEQGLLLRRHTLSTVASTSVLAALKERRVSRSEDVLAVADPELHPPESDRRERSGAKIRAHQLEFFENAGASLDALPASRQEARWIASAGGKESVVLEGSGASEKALRAAQEKPFAVLHFASHALLDPVAPQRSALVLSAADEDDGLLQAREIADLRFNAELAVLAACRSGRDQAPPGGAVQGLALSFFDAGARSVIASLWSVDDRASAVTLLDFYRSLDGKHSIAEALQEAQLGALERYGLEEPRLWAPWILLGEAQTQIVLPGKLPSERKMPPPKALGAYVLALVCLFFVWVRRKSS